MREITRIQHSHRPGRLLKTLQWYLLLAVFTIRPALFQQSAFAEQTPIKDLDARLTQTATIRDLIQYAYAQNPSIQEAREAWQATVENFRLVTGYPDPELMVSYYPNPIETRLGPQDWNASISQKIPFPGKLSKAGEVVEAEARIAKLDLDKTVRNIIFSIRESFHELLYIRKAKQVTAQNIKLLAHLRKVGETAYARDRAALLDMIKAQSQTGQLRYDALLLEELEQTEKTRLNGLLNRPPEAKIGPFEAETFPSLVYRLDEMYRLAEANQEEIQMAEAGVEKAEARVDLAQLENLPDFKLGLFYAAIGNPDVGQPPPNAGDDAVGVQAGVTIPLWFGKNKSRMNRARAEVKKAKAAKTSRINETHTQIRAIFFRLENARRLTELYQKELLPQAAKAMEIAETWFQQGQSSFSDFIEAQSVWYNFQLALARARADYGKNLARLERYVGQSITVRRDLSINDTGKEAK